MSAVDESPTHNADCTGVQQRPGEHLLPDLQQPIDSRAQLHLGCGRPLQGEDLQLVALHAKWLNNLRISILAGPTGPSYVFLPGIRFLSGTNKHTGWIAIVACLMCQTSILSFMQGSGAWLSDTTTHFNILVFDHGAVNHCQADGGEIKSNMPTWQTHPEGMHSSFVAQSRMGSTIFGQDSRASCSCATYKHKLEGSAHRPESNFSAWAIRLHFCNLDPVHRLGKLGIQWTLHSLLIHRRLEQHPDARPQRMVALSGVPCQPKCFSVLCWAMHLALW